jgi:3-deoxy-7-phosphoheptulonate synthase
MLVVLTPQTPEAVVASVEARLRMAGLAVHRTEYDGRVRFAAVGESGAIDPKQVEGWAGVESVAPLKRPFKLASRAFHPHDTVISVGRVAIGGPQLAVMAGPCSVESEHQIQTVATSPYAFQGLGEEGLKLMRRAADAHGLAVVSEVMDPQMVPLLARYCDILQIGARNMQNYALLREVGHLDKPVLLKRGLSSTIEEWLLSAEHVMAQGNRQVILCERGIRTFETYTRNTLDLNAVPVVKELSHLPVIVDPSHGVGIRDKVASMTRAAIAAGADGVIVEVHHDPDRALSDGPQSLYPEEFAELVRQIRTIGGVLGRTV